MFRCRGGSLSCLVRRGESYATRLAKVKEVGLQVNGSSPGEQVSEEVAGKCQSISQGEFSGGGCLRAWTS